VVIADLVAEPPRTRMDEHRHKPRPKAERFRSVVVVDLVHPAHLDEVIAGADSAELIAAPLDGPPAHLVGIGAIEAATALEVLEVSHFAKPVANGPARPLEQDVADIFARE